MLSLVGIAKAYGNQTLLGGVDWTVTPGERIGLVGLNGAGKSTLLRIVAGQVEPDRGEVRLAKGASVGYLPQEIIGMSGRSVRTTAMDAFETARRAEARCRELEKSLESTPHEDEGYAALLEEYSRAWEAWERFGSYDLESRAEEVLMGLGFTTADFRRDVGEFSGGWQMRVALARLLLESPEVLLLDEPTNHLDLEARNWLEGFLASYPGAVILVAHDRYFLDVTVTRIVEVERGRLTEYSCNYSRYEVEKAERLEQARRAYENQQAEIERMEGFIRKFRYQASKAKLVQSRVKQLEKLERLEPPPGTRELHFRLPPAPRSGRRTLELHGAGKRYGEIVVYEGLDLVIERGERIVLVGPNGAGKTTLVKLLAEVEPLTNGRRAVGHDVEVGYFAQDQSGVLDPGKTVLREVLDVAPFEMAPKVRSLLGAFLFSGETVDKRTSVLSGGERNRLALAKLLLRPTNVLLLDEPTNHLDLHAKDVLLEALQNYEGTIVLVSHDRYILDVLPTCVLEVGRGRAVRYLGNYEDYLAKKRAEEEAAAAPRPVPEPAAKPKPVSDASSRKGARPRRAEAPDPARLTERIAALEEEQSNLSDELSKPDFYRTHPDPHRILGRYEELKSEIERLYGDLDRVLGEDATS